MREIKFRAWDKNKKVMTFVGELAWLVGGLHFMDAGACQGFIDKDAELMQFTGLKDKNGKEIYEGDLIKLDSFMPPVMQICFIEGAFCIADRNGHYTADMHYVHHAGINQSEVIGNIYENKDLV